MLGRIKKKSKLILYFPKKEQKCPLTFQILLGDDETEVPVTFWNHLALDFYNLIDVGDILIISGYRMKEDPKRCHFGHFDVEFSLNDHKTKIYKLASYGEESFARIHHKIKSTNEITKLENDEIFDFVGTIVNISDYDRLKDGFGNYSQFKWITMLDHSSSLFLKCKIFTNSQKEKVDSLRISDICLFTELQLKIISETEFEKILYCSSTMITRIFDEMEIENKMNLDEEPEDSFFSKTVF
jgi:hypothetical protein